ncbi:MAG: Adenosine monophosphate-protein transferase SoFic [Chlamydiae bacterium]|nr:Adenosine monophosphate-protein transferase SoFic [Chlamydiota bacterium]
MRREEIVYQVPKLPLSLELETRSILKQLVLAHRALAELKGVAGTIPNQSILINTLSLQEAKESSAIENIITSHDDLYRSDNINKQFPNHAAKEVHNYAAALRNGYRKVKTQGLITNTSILEIQATIEENSAGFRKLPGTELKDEKTGQIVYIPPQQAQQVEELMSNLEKYINDDSLIDLDPLIKMAVIHHQFESIHPFYDGNGRTGRIINVLYLVKLGLLDTPTLYLSRYINENKGEYYRLLQAVRDEKAWEEWILFILDAIMHTSYETIRLIQGIYELMLHHKNLIREELPKIYSPGLVNHLFRHPYTKIEFITIELDIHRNTGMKYLDALVDLGLLEKHKMGTENFYVNTDLFDLLQKAGAVPQKQ